MPPPGIRPRPMARVLAVRRIASRMTPVVTVAREMMSGMSGPAPAPSGTARSTPEKPLTNRAISSSDKPRVRIGSLCRISLAPLRRPDMSIATSTSSGWPEYPTERAISQVEAIWPTVPDPSETLQPGTPSSCRVTIAGSSRSNSSDASWGVGAAGSTAFSNPGRTPTCATAEAATRSAQASVSDMKQSIRVIPPTCAVGRKLR